MIVGEFAVPQKDDNDTETRKEKDLKLHIIQKNISEIDNFVEEIDRILADNEPISDKIIVEQQNYLNQLKKEKEDYEKIR